jgi:hypothetical protein
MPPGEPTRFRMAPSRSCRARATDNHTNKRQAGRCCSLAQPSRRSAAIVAPVPASNRGECIVPTRWQGCCARLPRHFGALLAAVAVVPVATPVSRVRRNARRRRRGDDDDDGIGQGSTIRGQPGCGNDNDNEMAGNSKTRTTMATPPGSSASRSWPSTQTISRRSDLLPQSPEEQNKIDRPCTERLPPSEARPPRGNTDDPAAGRRRFLRFGRPARPCPRRRSRSAVPHRSVHSAEGAGDNDDASGEMMIRGGTAFATATTTRLGRRQFPPPFLLCRHLTATAHGGGLSLRQAHATIKRPTERIREAPAAQVKPLYRDRSFLQCESRRSLSADARVHLTAVGSAFDGSKVELNGWLGSGVRSFDDDDDDGSSTSAQASARHHRKRSQQHTVFDVVEVVVAAGTLLGRRRRNRGRNRGATCCRVPSRRRRLVPSGASLSCLVVVGDVSR